MEDIEVKVVGNGMEAEGVTEVYYTQDTKDY